jgi:NTP pyrophosphatase (non-canonical NTP hydrolase)
MAELKPCPFCGGEAEIRKGNLFMSKVVKVMCTDCFAATDYVFIDHPPVSAATGKLNETKRYTEEQATEIAVFRWNHRKDENDHMNTHQFIRERVPKEELLALLAEEATELAQAALKLRRVYNGVNPTPVKHDEAYQHLKEEIADVRLVIDVLGVGKDHMERCMIQANKLSRWVKRLENAE